MEADILHGVLGDGDLQVLLALVVMVIIAVPVFGGIGLYRIWTCWRRKRP
ncbi:MAG TPA: hypothetical protein VN579_05850 [Bryobacteraceae bacterium]|jgi:hypothetical protein|nr:hypothetical protein [Bryobacteraceae bacterium]